MKSRSPMRFILALIMILQLTIFSLPVFAAGTNLPNVTEYGMYNYVDDNLTPPTAIGSVIVTGNDGVNYTPPPWPTLENVPSEFSGNVAIGIKFATNIATPTYWDQNVGCVRMYDSDDNEISISVVRAGDGTNVDVNRNYMFIIPQETLPASSSLTIIIDSSLTSNNGQTAGKTQEVVIATEGGESDNTAPVWTGGSLTATNVQATTLTLEWSGASDDVELSGYRIYQDDTIIDEVDGSTETYGVTGLTSDTTYTFKVEAGDSSDNWSSDGPSTSIQTKVVAGAGDEDVTPPTWPAGSSVQGTKISAEVVELEWTEATDDIGVTAYAIYVDDGLEDTVDGSETTYTVSGLTPGTTHIFKVEAGDDAGNWSDDGPSVTVGGSGDKPLNFMGAYLTEISGNDSTTGEDIEGSTDVPLNPTIKLNFDKNVVNDSIWDNNLDCFHLEGNNVDVAINVFRISDQDNFDERQNIFIEPENELEAGESYEIIISADLMAKNGNTLGETTDGDDVVVSFSTISSHKGGIGIINPDLGGEVSIDGTVKVVIPPDAFDSEFEVTLEEIAKTSGLPMQANSKLISKVIEALKDMPGDFSKPVTVTMNFDRDLFDQDKYNVSIYWLDEISGKWIELDNVNVDLNAGTVSGEVMHFTKFAIIATEKVTQVILTDIAGHWAEADINKLVALGAVDGYPDGTFKPDAYITRAEFVKVLVKAFKLEAKSGKVFDDTINSWARDYIATANAYGIVDGYNDQQFGPDDLITREQIVKMVVKVANYSPEAGTINFTDSASISPWAVEAITTAIKNGVISGFPDNTIRPGNNASRGEAVTFIARALK